jgi:hypothetical protein
VASRDTLQKFQSSWQQTAAWAQSRGLKYNDYFPIYQQDSQLLIQYGNPMSQSERERRVLAAGNVQQGAQLTPSTAAKPSNVIGNSITDLRNIFTGIGDIAIHPLHNGLVDSVKNTFDLIDGAHHLQGASEWQKLGDAMTSTVLSWIPGVMDVGTVLQAPNIEQGLAMLADHPISSILDVMPIAKPLAFIGPESEAAARVGMTVDDARKATVGRVLKGYIKQTPTSTSGPLRNLTVGEKLSQIMGKKIGVNEQLKSLYYGNETLPNSYTGFERSLFAEADRISENWGKKEWDQLHEVMDPASKLSVEERLNMSDVDPKVKEMANALIDGPIRFAKEQAIAREGVTQVTETRTGKVRTYSVTDNEKILNARAAAEQATKDIMEVIPQLAERVVKQAKLNQATGMVAGTLNAANKAVREIQITGNVVEDLPGKRQRAIFGKKGLIQKLFGDGGLNDQIMNHVREGRWEDVVTLTSASLRRMSKWDRESVDITDEAFNPEQQQQFGAVRDQVQKLHDLAQEHIKERRNMDMEIHGRAEHWELGHPEREELYQRQIDTQKQQHADQIRTLDRQKRTQFGMLTASFNRLKRTIDEGYARQKAQATEDLTSGVRNIHEKYELEKAKATTRHLQARENQATRRTGRRAQGLPAPRDYIHAMEAGEWAPPGAVGTKEAITAEHNALELQKQAEIQDHIARTPTRDQLEARHQRELRDMEQMKNQMMQRLTRMYDQTMKATKERQAKDERVLKAELDKKKALNGRISLVYKQYIAAQEAFADAVWAKPPDVFNDLYFQTLAKHLVENEASATILSKTEQVLADKYQWGKEQIAQIRSNPVVLGTLVQRAVEGAFDHPIFDHVDESIIYEAQASALNEINRLRMAGLDPQYIPHVSDSQIRADATGSYGIHLVVANGIPKPDMFSPRTWGMDSSRFDIMAGLHRGAKQLLDQSATIDYVNTYLSPRTVGHQQLIDSIMTRYPDEVGHLSESSFNSWVDNKLKDWNLTEFDPEKTFGFRMPKWGQGKVYIDRDLLGAVEKLTKGGLPTKSVLDKATKLFRYSILGLSPRYTAHIVFGGTFLLALRSSPYAFTMLGDMVKMLRSGQQPEDLLTTPSQIGTTDYQLRPRTAQDASYKFHYQGGADTAHYLAQEDIELNQKVKLAAAKPFHWVKALADINLRFTHHVVNMQRSIAYLDGAAKASRKAARHGGKYVDEHGVEHDMTPERMAYEGMRHAEKVMGDLRKMSPLERQVARTIVPFYGWEKHILQYVLSFPADHPWRAMMLANMAEYDTTHEGSGLPSRYQFLFFLGHPDDQGNVTALDFRAMNPLRDVANYATAAGFIQSINPVLTSVVTMVDPQIIYGSNTLYPKLTYDQFYGIEEAGAQGNLLTAAKGIVPQLGAMQSAMQIAGARHNLSSGALVKNIYESLGVPMIQPQHINLKQEAAKTAAARYQVTKSLTDQAWQTGDFSSIADLGSVPDPRNPEYETPVATLQQLYAQLQKEYPGVPPATVAQSLPALHL